MATGTLLVSLIAAAGWLFLNWRAMHSLNLSFEQKAAMAVVWLVIFGVLAFVFARLGF